MATFHVNTEGDIRTVDLDPARPLVIGRSRETDVHLDDPSLSRRHCEVRRVGAQWVLKDLGSFNGTYCNNLAVSEHRLQHGDQVQLGLSVLTFLLSPEELRAGQPVPATGSADVAEMSRRLRNFKSLLDISKAVSGVLDTHQLLELVVEKGIGLTNAERGFLILFTSPGQEFKVARSRDWHAIDHPEKQVSRSVIASVETSGEPVLTIDAQSDLASMSQTIAGLEIRSLMCAPLRVKDDVLGCIYVDSSVSEQEFSQESLNLLQAFADQAAIAIENARLYDAMNASRESEKHVRQIFQKYVPKDVVQRALQLQDGGRLSAKVYATVLFSDIRGFTSTSERMQPEEVVAFLNDYLQRMVEIVFDEGGIVDKFIGDAVMAIFGAPLSRPDDPLRAVRAAQRMLQELDRFNEDQAKKGGVHIRIGIGIHSGMVIAGNIGSDRKMEYTVIGDTVNIASRVQDLTKEFGVEIIITQGCYDGTQRAVPARLLPPVHVKGKEHALTVYEVPRAEVAAVEGVRAEKPTLHSGVVRWQTGTDLDGPTLPRAGLTADNNDPTQVSAPVFDPPPTIPPPPTGRAPTGLRAPVLRPPSAKRS